MPIQRSKGILLRRQALRETSFILSFYTRDFGKIKGVVKGARGSRAIGHGGGAYEIFALDDIVFYERKAREIYTISQCDLAEYFMPVRRSLEKVSYAMYLAELLDSVSGMSDPHPDVFDLTLGCLGMISDGAYPRGVARLFEIKLLSCLGIMPTLGMCAQCESGVDTGSRFSLRHGGLLCKNCTGKDINAYPILRGTARFIEHVQGLPIDKAIRIKVAEEVARELETILRRFLDYHIERRLNTLKFLKLAEMA
ncbi:MAG: DNA repair protein RecO [Candidatus Omnitrophica bacterium]|nr:DNA repair protein RecO [Candidatus Omnitrophota bacterium]